MKHNMYSYLASWYCMVLQHIMFLNVFYTYKNRFLTYCVFRILLGASKIATDFFVIKLLTCKS